MSTTIVDVPLDQRVEQVRPERCSRGNLYVAEDVNRREVMLIGQKLSSIQQGIEALFPCESPAVSSLHDVSVNKHRKGKTGAWSVHRLSPEELSPFVAERRKFFARTVIATSNLSAWQLTTVT